MDCIRETPSYSPHLNDGLGIRMGCENVNGVWLSEVVDASLREGRVRIWTAPEVVGRTGWALTAVGSGGTEWIADRSAASDGVITTSSK